MKSLTRLFAIMHKELLQILRDRLTFGMIVGVPLLQLTLFGFAINTDVRNLRAAVADEANTSLSREMIADMSASQVVDFQYHVDSPMELNRLLDAGLISVGLHIPADFDRRVQQNAGQAAQLLVDGTDPVIQGVARQLTAMPVSFDSRVSPRNIALIELRNFYNPERRSAINVVPGLIGVILTMTMVLFTGLAIVRERERGNLELLINTPIKRTELMLGKILPYVVIGLIQVTIILLLGRFLFQVPIRGSLLDVFIVVLVFIATNLSLGLLISTVAQTQFQAMQIAFFFFLPSILLSGFMFPFHGMPLAAQYLAEILPLTHFVRLIRGVMLRGADLNLMLTDILALLLFLGVTLTMATLRFSKRLD
ncbi:MAG: ABC transporter permease [Gammaproteobacteria bacterium]|nr:ABC transporter permease [Gammaproteobacteria bacterium]MDP2142235.1 ABC transporter permease [Gammaproteobacteria bacterium]MDP2347884.1 ABC transporter permease [Gammaproteobacteria bacterium]